MEVCSSSVCLLCKKKGSVLTPSNTKKFMEKYVDTFMDDHPDHKQEILTSTTNSTMCTDCAHQATLSYNFRFNYEEKCKNDSLKAAGTVCLFCNLGDDVVLCNTMSEEFNLQIEQFMNCCSLPELYADSHVCLACITSLSCWSKAHKTFTKLEQGDLATPLNNTEAASSEVIELDVSEVQSKDLDDSKSLPDKSDGVSPSKNNDTSLSLSGTTTKILGDLNDVQLEDTGYSRFEGDIAENTTLEANSNEEACLDSSKLGPTKSKENLASSHVPKISTPMKRSKSARVKSSSKKNLTPLPEASSSSIHYVDVSSNSDDPFDAIARPNKPKKLKTMRKRESSSSSDHAFDVIDYPNKLRKLEKTSIEEVSISSNSDDPFDAIPSPNKLKNNRKRESSSSSEDLFDVVARPNKLRKLKKSRKRESPSSSEDLFDVVARPNKLRKLKKTRKRESSSSCEDLFDVIARPSRQLRKLQKTPIDEVSISSNSDDPFDAICSPNKLKKLKTTVKHKASSSSDDDDAAAFETITTRNKLKNKGKGRKSSARCKSKFPTRSFLNKALKGLNTPKQLRDMGKLSAPSSIFRDVKFCQIPYICLSNAASDNSQATHCIEISDGEEPTAIPYVCKVCDKTFNDKLKSQIHTLYHEKPETLRINVTRHDLLKLRDELNSSFIEINQIASKYLPKNVSDTASRTSLNGGYDDNSNDSFVTAEANVIDNILEKLETSALITSDEEEGNNSNSGNTKALITSDGDDSNSSNKNCNGLQTEEAKENDQNGNNKKLLGILLDPNRGESPSKKVRFSSDNIEINIE